MKCRGVEDRLSDYLEGSLPEAEAVAVAEHLFGCVSCARRRSSLRRALNLLAELPRMEAPGVAAAVVSRLELERRGPGLALLFRPAWNARPLILPSLVPAVLVLVTVIAGAMLLDADSQPRASLGGGLGEPWDSRLPPSEIGRAHV